MTLPTSSDESASTAAISSDTAPWTSLFKFDLLAVYDAGLNLKKDKYSILCALSNELYIKPNSSGVLRN